jgi:preprotein translocase, SecE subunit, bacterial
MANKNVQKLEKNTNKAKSKKETKPNVFARFGHYCKDVISELKRVTWPTGKELVCATRDVVLFIVALAIIVGLLDVLFGFLMKLLVQ